MTLSILVYLICAHNQTAVGQPTDEAQRIYQEFQKSVYQIRVINISTGKKTIIGSGFQFSDQGHIATNYHVVSEALHRPSVFKLEAILHDGTKTELNILDIDVIHDLAILQDKNAVQSFFPLGQSDLDKGTRIFAMGNPHDLGMSIVEGTYNGLMEQSLYKKILFSGSLNSGMSGGPALNREGRVIGVNVATQGNQISFLVPVEYLHQLFENVQRRDSAPVKNWYQRIENQLLANQNLVIDRFMSTEWDSLPIGDALVPGEILKAFKCWGQSEDETKELYDYAYIHCSTEDNIFLSSSLTTGKITYKYMWVTSAGLNPIRFYNLYESFYKYPEEYYNAQKVDASNFECSDGFVDINGKNMKVALCARRYKKFGKLYDINLNMASVDEKDKGLLIEMVILGVSQERIMDFVNTFMKEIKWKKSS